MTTVGRLFRVEKWPEIEPMYGHPFNALVERACMAVIAKNDSLRCQAALALAQKDRMTALLQTQVLNRMIPFHHGERPWRAELPLLERGEVVSQSDGHPEKDERPRPPRTLPMAGSTSRRASDAGGFEQAGKRKRTGQDKVIRTGNCGFPKSAATGTGARH